MRICVLTQDIYNYYMVIYGQRRTVLEYIIIVTKDSCTKLIYISINHIIQEGVFQFYVLVTNRDIPLGKPSRSYLNITRGHIH